MTVKNKKIVILLSVAILFILFILVAICAQPRDYYDTDDRQVCENIMKDGTCGVWTNNTCYAGVYKNNQCALKSNTMSSIAWVNAIMIFFLLVFLCFQS